MTYKDLKEALNNMSEEELAQTAHVDLDIVRNGPIEVLSIEIAKNLFTEQVLKIWGLCDDQILLISKEVY